MDSGALALAPDSIPENPAYEIFEPGVQTAPVVFASPHSGEDYPAHFLNISKLDAYAIRRSEDSFVDQLYSAAPACGAPLLCATFPRAFVDPNREPFELDPDMFDDPLPDYANPTSPRVAAGLGTIAKVVCSGAEIYDGKLRFAEALDRINSCYRPYHSALQALIDRTRDRFGYCILVDCHSMPSVGGPMDRDPGRRRVDFVLGDCYGVSCHRSLTDQVHATLVRLGYMVKRNLPYAGGFTTRHYGEPSERVHALQIEVNRALYMDETRFAKRPGFETLLGNITIMIEQLVSADEGLFAA